MSLERIQEISALLAVIGLILSALIATLLKRYGLPSIRKLAERQNKRLNDVEHLYGKSVDSATGKHSDRIAERKSNTLDT